MPKNLGWRLGVIGLILVVGIYWFVFPEDRGRGWFSRLNLGLDLKGGVHLILQVVTDDALNQEVTQVAERIAQELRTKGTSFASSKKGAGFSVEVAGVEVAKDREVRQFLESSYDREYGIRSVVVEGKNNYTLTLLKSTERKLKETTVSQALETIRRRVDALGVSEPTLQIYGQSGTEIQDQIIVELPGVD